MQLFRKRIQNNSMHNTVVPVWQDWQEQGDCNLFFGSSKHRTSYGDSIQLRILESVWLFTGHTVVSCSVSTKSNSYKNECVMSVRSFQFPFTTRFACSVCTFTPEPCLHLHLARHFSHSYSGTRSISKYRDIRKELRVRISTICTSLSLEMFPIYRDSEL